MEMVKNEKDIAFNELKTDISNIVIDLATKIIMKEL